MESKLTIYTGIFLISLFQLTACSSGKPETTFHASVESHEQLEDKIKRIVKDEARAEKAADTAEDMFELAEDFIEDMSRARKQLVETSSDYDVSRASLEADFQSMVELRRKYSGQYRSLSIYLRSVVTEPEWQQISKYFAERMSSMSTDHAEKG